MPDIEPYIQPEYNRFCYWKMNTFQHFEHMLLFFDVCVFDEREGRAIVDDIEETDLARALETYNDFKLEPGQFKYLNVSIYVPVDTDEQEAIQHRECFLVQCLLEESNPIPIPAKENLS